MNVQFIISNEKEEILLHEGNRDCLKTIDYFDTYKEDKELYLKKNYDYQIKVIKEGNYENK
jgi:hypothetical protein